MVVITPVIIEIQAVAIFEKHGFAAYAAPQTKFMDLINRHCVLFTITLGVQSIGATAKPNFFVVGIAVTAITIKFPLFSR